MIDYVVGLFIGMLILAIQIGMAMAVDASRNIGGNIIGSLIFIVMYWFIGLLVVQRFSYPCIGGF